MSSSIFNGVELAYDDTGSGPSLVLVHGSWVDRRRWSLVTQPLSGRFRVVTYDRRGHSESERPAAQGSVHEDVADLAALIESLDLAPAHVVSNSFGGSISLRLAGERPDLFASLSVHEPPLFALLADDPTFAPVVTATTGVLQAVASVLDNGDLEGGARMFVDTVIGSGAWELLPAQVQQTFIKNAPTFLDESRDPEALTLDLSQLANFTRPTLLSIGSASPPFFAPVIGRLLDALPSARTHTFEGAGHVPQDTHPDQFVEVVSSFIQGAA